MDPLLQRYVAAMVLSGVGDALGFRNESWEFCTSGQRIHKELQELGGLDGINVSGWRVSDDTVMHLATAQALTASSGSEENQQDLYSRLAVEYQQSMMDMTGRAAGKSNTDCRGRAGTNCVGQEGTEHIECFNEIKERAADAEDVKQKLLEKLSICGEKKFQAE
ncbi:hypothetical protein chiPu_0025732 [Chiloscyllium punctatum]|uniref:ADP-ribosylhydrolase ARH1 n=1 Tax=Chiloscyllium punctatum TaxID=137246 RepID=A0A401TGP1_CHIPU|nr:hypothetical protein [Chiloscyllium punctatum]